MTDITIDVEWEVEGTGEGSSPGQASNVCHSQLEALSKDLWKLRSQGTMCDVILDVGGEKLHAHKLVLIAASPKLQHDLSKTRPSTDGKLYLDIADISYKVCTKLLHYVYTGTYSCSFDTSEDLTLTPDEFLLGCMKWSLKFWPNGWSIPHEDNSSVIPSTNNNLQVQDSFPKPKAELGLENTAHNHEQEVVEDTLEEKTKIVISRTRKGKKTKKVSPPKRRRMSPRISKSNNDCTARSLVSETSSTSDVQKDVVDSKTETSFDDHESVKEPSMDENINSGNNELLTNSNISVQETEAHDSKSLVKNEFEDEITTNRHKKVKSPSRKTVNGRKKHRCGYCGSEFNSQNDLKVHRIEDHRQKKKAESWCTICKTKFNGRNLLLAHNIERHWSEGMELPKIYKCNRPGCEFHTYVQGTWYAHMSHMHNTEPIVCEICGRSYKHRFSLSSHMRHAHGPKKEFPCEDCERVFASETGLRNHKNVVHKLKVRLQQICPHCGHTCLCQSTLSEHLYTKHDILPKGRTGYECKYCDFKTLTVSVLNRHQSRHLPDRPYKCDQCNKSYPDRNQLKYHQIKHDNSATEYRCQYCNYSSKYIQHFKEHVQVRHEKKDFKPFSCEDCSYRCNSRGNLYKHIRKVHKRVVKTKQKLSRVPNTSEQHLPSSSHGDEEHSEVDAAPESDALVRNDVITDTPSFVTPQEHYQNAPQEPTQTHRIFTEPTITETSVNDGRIEAQTSTPSHVSSEALSTPQSLQVYHHEIPPNQLQNNILQQFIPTYQPLQQTTSQQVFSQDLATSRQQTTFVQLPVLLSQPPLQAIPSIQSLPPQPSISQCLVSVSSNITMTSSSGERWSLQSLEPPPVPSKDGKMDWDFGPGPLTSNPPHAAGSSANSGGHSNEGDGLIVGDNTQGTDMPGSPTEMFSL